MPRYRPPSAPDPAQRSPLPNFCELPVLFALFVVGALTVTVMWLARDAPRDWAAFSVGMLFVTWLALLMALALCKLRPLLQRLPGLLPYLGVWLVLVAIAVLASLVAYWLDDALNTRLVQGAWTSFLRNNVLITALLGAAMLRYFYVLAQWQARLAAVTRAQVEALQARIRPHFLFNSMNTVAALIHVDPSAAERTVEDLCELFRAALGQQGTADGTLGEELALIERYLAIEQLRLGDRLRVRRDLAGLPPGFPVPRLLLQPLVENAVRHGIQPLRGGGEITLAGHLDAAGAVDIEVRNPLPDAPAAAGTGHGLASVRQRVAWRYGPQARVQAGPQGGEFVVALHLPVAAA